MQRALENLVRKDLTEADLMMKYELAMKNISRYESEKKLLRNSRYINAGGLRCQKSGGTCFL